jgi:hypothetical protein
MTHEGAREPVDVNTAKAVEVERRREVWTRAEATLLERTAMLFHGRRLMFQVVCAGCKHPVPASFNTISGNTELNCKCSLRVLERKL